MSLAGCQSMTWNILFRHANSRYKRATQKNNNQMSESAVGWLSTKFARFVESNRAHIDSQIHFPANPISFINRWLFIHLHANNHAEIPKPQLLNQRPNYNNSISFRVPFHHAHRKQETLGGMACGKCTCDLAAIAPQSPLHPPQMMMYITQLIIQIVCRKH